MENFKIYAKGKFLISKQSLIVNNKYTLKPFSKTWLADENLLNQTIDFCQKIFSQCLALSSYQKKEALLYISQQILIQKSKLARLLSIESAKPITYALAEIERSANAFYIAAEECSRLPKEYLSLDNVPNGIGVEGIVKYFPIGIVAGISPFNFPLNLAVHKIAPAIAAGCPIILKPASYTPLSTLALAKIIHNSNLPKGMVNILPMERHIGEKLVTNNNIKLLSFTGSPEIGWDLKSKSGKKKIVLELGGNAGVIVSKNVNVKKIINKCVYGAFAYSGQICIHAQRFFIHEELFNSFIKEFKNATVTLKKGNPLHKNTQLSNLIDEKNALRVEAWIKEAVSKGAQIICGGKRIGNYIEPTILTNTNNSMKVYSEEIFGPVICVEKYDGDIKTAVKKINDTKYGLQCGVFTDSISELNYCFNTIEVGGVIHNHVPTLRFDAMPYGGIKESGLGREGIKYAIFDMLEPKILVK
ncbi:MAG: aldehyde dehydrogenase family protein [Bacteroidetes bacterium]|nr:aldehyde dehydrogenase family protein [Bacteroidota bacterium]